MKSTTFLVSLLIFLSFQNCSAQQLQNKTTQVESDGYKGKVKQVKQGFYKAIETAGEPQQGEIATEPVNENYLYKYDETGKLIEDIYYNKDGSINFRLTYKHDDNGLIIEKYRWNAEGVLENKFNFDFDSESKIIERRSYNAKGKIYYKSQFKYNANGKLIEKTSYANDDTFDGKETYTYNDSGFVSKMIHENTTKLMVKGFLPDSYYKTYQYDEKGNKIEEEHGSSSNNEITKATWKYDDKRREIEANAYKPNGKLDYRTTWKYDDHGNQNEMNDYKSNGSLRNHYIFKYDYDTNGNWIKRTEFLNNKPTFITIREITYFE